ncbi:hypothetical protein HGRIS_013099 [Hohenbuehelia grisea]|uniref:Man1/Src1 C-terminal domain-containing protein n=1 Tax=Hohenbuehelia grisea TaxID=104357 RepID=A0ABR3IUC3_9AGAR
MSRMTAAQIVAIGEYLNPDFDPSTLTVSQLLGVFGFHNIPFPTPYPKAKLVQIFNDEIKAKAPKLKRERLKKENSIASDEGITDGITGEPLGGRKPVARRSSRRLSRAPSQEEETSPVRPDPPKRRRSSAQPSLGGPSRRTARTPAAEALAEESEPEEDLPARKVGRSKKTQAAGSQARRVSNPLTEDSGWEDNNIFQSGAESSPSCPSPSRPKSTRKSLVPRKSRKSMSAPPQSPTRARLDPPVFLPEAKFEPTLPPSVEEEARRIASGATRSARPSSSGRRQSLKTEQPDDELDLIGQSDIRQPVFLHDVPEELGASEDKENQDPSEEMEPEVAQTVAISERIAEGAAVVPHRPLDQARFSTIGVLIRLVIVSAAFSLLPALYVYKQEALSIGYCDTGRATNDALELLNARLVADHACHPENRTILDIPSLIADRIANPDARGTDLDCPLSALLPLPHPSTCTPCPEHAECEQNDVICDRGFVLTSHPLAFFLPAVSMPATITLSAKSTPVEVAWKVISWLVDGYPWSNSVALPPRCLPDQKLRQSLNEMAAAADKILGQVRGDRLCSGQERPTDGGEAKQWGLSREELRAALKLRVHQDPVDFEINYNDLLEDLLQKGVLAASLDSSDTWYYAHSTPDLTLACSLKVKTRELWRAWRVSVFGVLLTIVGAYAARWRSAARAVERQRVSELVQIALEALQNQELAHHTDPVIAPQPYLSSLQLRDLILQEEHSIPTRRQLWDQVERVVEGNANVRANLEEVHGGDELRVWRWVGSTGRSPVKRPVLAEKQEEEPQDGEGYF